MLLDMSRHSLVLGREAVEKRTAANSISNEPMWSDYVEGNVIEGESEQWPPEGSTSTGGWVETTWTQKWPNHHYCPEDPSTGAKCVVGCVATAMSQIIDYHADKDNYLPVVKLEGWDRYTSYSTDPPIYIDGDSSKYDFPSFDALNEYMIDASNAYNTDSKITYHELGALSFVCGITVKMQYSSDGSGSQVKTVARALRRKFNYPSPTYITVSQTMYDKLKSNMKSALPAELSIYSSGGGPGHAIVCDGLREEEGKPDYFHLNYGWGEGSPENIVNCWFTLPDGMWGFDIIGGAVLDIVPPVGNPAVAEPPQNDNGGIELSINTVPVDGKFTLSYTINKPAEVKASVYDAAGAKVRTLFDNKSASGTHMVSFEPTDENARPLPDGSYFLIFTDRRTIVTRKIIVTD
ncbi:T9SS type A sorting domain-containing protein [candidate division WOR-3 bacterium]|uniref:T9SS type A sorting domain-containing protein n=1 Tax=candidate division WOR-3 bacterium TaxID=2052148 RepID=A0A9D5QE92_UNCW3|nr:T9SS type A sorting domain-containing protein [candidate division WOR-3 bacterium]MBD3364815.1 T9SS type A sorting domain-containing protein [candidate division WOR-3 bacterium]